MEERREEIKRALKIIRDECKSHEICSKECPMKTSKNECAIIDLRPDKWVFADETNSIII